MLCASCQKLALPTNVAGSCRACTSHTEYFAYKLCSDCSDKLDQCERCEAPLHAASSPIVQPGATAYRVTLKDNDNGSSLPGMHPGEEIVVILEEDQYSQTEWGAKSSSLATGVFRLKANNGFVPFPGQYQKGTRELIFEIIGTGNVDLELEEKVRSQSWFKSGTVPSTVPAPNGRRWKCSVQSK